MHSWFTLDCTIYEARAQQGQWLLATG
jgi:hypothetical protein